MLSDKKLASVMRVLPQDATGIFKDIYSSISLIFRSGTANPIRNPDFCATCTNSSWNWATASIGIMKAFQPQTNPKY
jgi:hypothetical protein